ncbi:hypothetical protein BT93_L3866 [Corymbia citriodora subsp. variegata]|uniref:GDT1 family protein n=1 Tax=Corymbia citriodora subsp. variegata TaxID=360336 RepID=A0A8T0CGV4_CORYI|nr:hypothetical protein BT93_L3866 [Corymbia citriodora subsp. variegata]
MSSVLQGFSKSLAMTVLSEIGDKTFFAAAVSVRLPGFDPRTLFMGFSVLLLDISISNTAFPLFCTGLLNIKWRAFSFSWRELWNSGLCRTGFCGPT